MWYRGVLLFLNDLQIVIFKVIWSLCRWSIDEFYYFLNDLEFV
jgi:hypothetical protein